MSFVITEYASVIAELERRGLLQATHESPLPNRAIGSLLDRELFYVQETPRLAAWVKYDTDEQWHEAFANVTVRRILQNEDTGACE